MPATDPGAAEASAWWQRATPSYVTRSVAAVAAIGVVIVGTAPMAMAAVNQSADPILTEALDGTPNALNTAGPAVLADRPIRPPGQPGQPTGPRGRSDLPRPGLHVRLPADRTGVPAGRPRLGGQAHQVDFVAIVANPIYRSASFTNAFDRQEDLTHLANWYYLTGSMAALQHVWNSYGVLVRHRAAGRWSRTATWPS